jgi:hypothetical protein
MNKQAIQGSDSRWWKPRPRPYTGKYPQRINSTASDSQGRTHVLLNNGDEYIINPLPGSSHRYPQIGEELCALECRCFIKKI